MVQRLVSRANGLELHIPADMGAGIRFFGVGEDARALIDNGEVNPNLTTTAQLQSELERTKKKLADLETAQAKVATKEVAKTAKKTPTSEVVVEPVKPVEESLA